MLMATPKFKIILKSDSWVANLSDNLINSLSRLKKILFDRSYYLIIALRDSNIPSVQCLGVNNKVIYESWITMLTESTETENFFFLRLFTAVSLARAFWTFCALRSPKQSPRRRKSVAATIVYQANRIIRFSAIYNTAVAKRSPYCGKRKNESGASI